MHQSGPAARQRTRGDRGKRKTERRDAHCTHQHSAPETEFTIARESEVRDPRKLIRTYGCNDLSINCGGGTPRAAFSSSPDDNRMPGGMYRNQFWFPFPGRNLLLCLGIHGQMVYVNPAANLVAVKLSSWPTPQNAVALFNTVAAFDAIADSVA